MRSALDYAIGELIAAETGMPAPANQHFEFPIFLDPADYAKAMWKNKGLSPSALILLESMQPYALGNAKRGRLLWQLHRIDIEDKHRQLAAAAGGMAVARVKHTGKGGAEAFSIRTTDALPQFPLEDGAVILRFSAAPDPEAKMEINIEDWVALENPPEARGEAIPLLLGNIFEDVKSRLTDMEALLP